MGEFPFKGRLAVLATMHRKERAIAPVLEESLGLLVEVCHEIDTDRFGTFTRDVPRPGTQLETARLKARAALAAVPGADFGLASEGSFGPHPWLPWVAGGRELIGADLTAETNWGSRLVSSVADAVAFTQDIGFPTHAVVVIGVHKGEPDVSKGVYKGLMTTEELENAIRVVLEQHGAAYVESDMRARINPTRLQAIERAARDLVRLALSGSLRTAGLRRRGATRGAALCGMRDTDAPRSYGNRRLHRLRLSRRTCPGPRTDPGVAG